MKGASDHYRLVAAEILPGPGGQGAMRIDDEIGTEKMRAETVADDAGAPRAKRKASSLLFWSTCMLAAFLVFWVAGGHRLVLEPLATTMRNAPAQALRIEDVTSRIDRRGSETNLVVEGAVRNHGADALAMPAIIIVVELEGGPTTRYVMETSPTPLAPGAQYGFSSRLEAPAAGIASVSITFQEGSR